MVWTVLQDTAVHNYDRFAKIGSSSAYSGYMKRMLSHLLLAFFQLLNLWRNKTSIDAWRDYCPFGTEINASLACLKGFKDHLIGGQ